MSVTRALYFDCFSGASGDMILGALLDSGFELEKLRLGLASLALQGYQLSAARVLRGAIAATKFDVTLEASQPQPARGLREILQTLETLAQDWPVVFPVHPRTRRRIEELGLGERLAGPGLRLCEPLGYLEFLGLTSQARLVLTDSGGLQEETTALGVPCLTLRENTERPVTVTEGTNQVVGLDPARIVAAAGRALDGEGPRGRTPALWDGRAGERAADAIGAFLAAAASGRGARPRGGAGAPGPARSPAAPGVWSAGDAPGAGPLHG